MGLELWRKGDHGFAITFGGDRMRLAEAFDEILNTDIPTSFQRFATVLDARWVEDALKKTGTASVRRRKLPAHLVVWLVIGMALFRDRSIQEVVSHLGLVLSQQKNSPAANRKTIAPSAIPQQRGKVGDAPIRVIFEHTATAWTVPAAEKNRWRGLTLYGLDGTTLRIPDTEGNREEFGLPGTGRAQSGYPQVRLVGLMALSSHLLAGGAFGPCRGKKTGELTLAEKLWPQVPEQALVIVDRGLISYGVFFRLSHDEDGTITGSKHWLVRGKKNLRWKTLETLGPGDELVELPLSKEARKKDPTLPTTMVARVIHYQLRGFRPQTLLTSMVDAQAYPAKEVIGLYHKRWEIELGYDEVKTHMLERQEALRSKTPQGIRQEVWGILLAYNLIRRKMLDVAEEVGLSPTQVSFRHSLQLIRVFCLVEAWTTAPSNLPKRLEGFHEMMGLLILPERRSERRYERHVKIKMSKFKRNKGRPDSNRSESKKDQLN